MQSRYFLNLDSHGFKCTLNECDRRCNSWDDVSVICPGCGPYSATRYCCKDHLLADTAAHWPVCGSLGFEEPCGGGLPARMVEGPPLIPNSTAWNNLERHRQNVYHAVNSEEGDYFVFSDWLDHLAAGIPAPTGGVLTPRRCKGRVLLAVKFDGEEKDRFNRLLSLALHLGLSAPRVVIYLFRMIRDKLAGRLNPGLQSCLLYQFRHEFGTPLSVANPQQPVAINPATLDQLYTVSRCHACETEWSGERPQLCPDPTCRQERTSRSRMLLLAEAGGLARLCESSEASSWILRVHRRYHPATREILDRMRGVGFVGVAEADRRDFCRGPAWDGFEAGEVEIESVNC